MGKPGWALIAINGESVKTLKTTETFKKLSAAAEAVGGDVEHRSASSEPNLGVAGSTDVKSDASRQPVSKAKAHPPVPAADPSGTKLPPKPDPPLPGSGMCFDFRLPDGSEKRVSFGSRKPPLGMEFEKDVPVSVKNLRPGGH